MLLELEELLAYERFQPRLDVLQQTPAQLATFSLSLASAFDVSRSSTPIVTADPDDNIFLLCADVANAVYVVTNDKHLLALKTYRETLIITIGEFFTREFNN
ncbi:hypothetical protein BH10CHL1_BH10CHL1_49450 [soil metagenome]